MNHGWEKKRLGDVCQINFGKRIVAKDTQPGPYYVYGGGGATFTTMDYNRENCMIVSRFAMSPECVRFVRGRFFLNDSGLSVDSSTDLLTQEFIDKYLWASQPQIYNLGRGAAQKNLNTKSFSELLIPIPTVNTQLKIVFELDKLIELIELKRNQVKDLDTLVQSLFYETFGEPFINSKGWQITNFGDLALSINYGTSLPATECGKYPYIRMNNLTDNGYLDLSSLKYIDIPDSELDKCLVKKGDILFNRTNSREKVGKTALFDRTEEMVIAGYIIRVRAKEEILNPVFAVRYMNLPELKKHLRKICRGAVNQANINSKEMASIPFMVPPIELQNEFAERIDAIEEQKRLIESSIADLETLLASRMDYWFND